MQTHKMASNTRVEAALRVLYELTIAEYFLVCGVWCVVHGVCCVWEREREGETESKEGRQRERVCVCLCIFVCWCMRVCVHFAYTVGICSRTKPNTQLNPKP